MLSCCASKQMMQTLQSFSGAVHAAATCGLGVSHQARRGGSLRMHAADRAAASVAFHKTSILGLEGDTSDAFLSFFLAVTRRNLRPSEIRERVCHYWTSAVDARSRALLTD